MQPFVAGMLGAMVAALVVGGHGRSGPAHPVHVSSTQVDLAGDQRSVEVTMRVFTDDLEAALKGAGRPVSVLSAPPAVVDSALAAYVLPRFTVAANGGPARRGTLVGHEREDDATLVYVEVPVPSPLSHLIITQPVLFELFDDQVNLLHFKAGTVKRSALLRRGAERGDFRW